MNAPAAECLLDLPGHEVWRADWLATAAIVDRRGGVDALVTDPPYSERTQAGHDAGTDDANQGTWKRPSDGVEVPVRKRRRITYAPWYPSDVDAFVEVWSPLVRGWFVTMTDHVLAPAWEAALQRSGRYVFAPIPWVESGSRVRMTGDGPTCWACWIIVARPRSFARWGSLPGAYVTPRGESERNAKTGGHGRAVVGGKPLWLGASLVRDYSREGDLVADPLAGAGTFGVAARLLGRGSLSADNLPEHAEMAADRIGEARLVMPADRWRPRWLAPAKAWIPRALREAA